MISKKTLFLDKFFQDVNRAKPLKPDVERTALLEIQRLETEFWKYILTDHDVIKIVISEISKDLQKTGENNQSKLKEMLVFAKKLSRTIKSSDKHVEQFIVSARLNDTNRRWLVAATHAAKSLDISKINAMQKKVRRAIDSFAYANQRLVVTMAKKFDRGRVPFEDLIQEGNIGLLKAIWKFDCSRYHSDGSPIRFSTCAAWWIKHHISILTKENGNVVKIPSRSYDHSAAVMKLLFDGISDPLELSKKTEVPLSTVKEIIGNVPRYMPALSLNMNPFGDGEETWLDSLADLNQVRADDYVCELEWSDHLQKIMRQVLDPIEIDILKSRFGSAEETLQTIASQYSLSRERIRQKETIAIKKLSNVIKKECSVWT